jgi:hypothetical protein
MAGNQKAAKLRQLLGAGRLHPGAGYLRRHLRARRGSHGLSRALHDGLWRHTASMLGLPDAGLATYSDMVGRAEMICSVIETPLIADADTGYGGAAERPAYDPRL